MVKAKCWKQFTAMKNRRKSFSLSLPLYSPQQQEQKRLFFGETFLLAFTSPTTKICFALSTFKLCLKNNFFQIIFLISSGRIFSSFKLPGSCISFNPHVEQFSLKFPNIYKNYFSLFLNFFFATDWFFLCVFVTSNDFSSRRNSRIKCTSTLRHFSRWTLFHARAEKLFTFHFDFYF